MSELRFRVTSSHPRMSSDQLVSQLLSDIPILTEHLREKWTMLPPELTIEADLEKSVPIDPASAYLILKFTGAAIAGGFLKKLGEDAYLFLKNCIKNGSIYPPRNQEP